MGIRAVVHRLFQWTRVHPHRLLVAPRVRLAAEAGEGGQAGEAGVLVRGMVCGVCAARTRDALASVPGVEDARVDLEGGVARLRLTPGTRVDGALEAALQRAVDGVVVGLGGRRWLERAAFAVLRAVRAAGGSPR